MKMRILCHLVAFPLVTIAFWVPGQITVAGEGAPEPAGWYAGDPHVHLDCGAWAGHDPVTPEQIFSDMAIRNLAVVSLLADMGNGELRDAARDLPKINGKDFPWAQPGRLLHWDAEWHFDPEGEMFEHMRKMIGGHLILLGLSRANTMFSEYVFPVIHWAKSQGAIVGFAHMEYLSEGIPEKLSCCLPLEYPVETALRAIDFLMEDVRRNEAAMKAYYRLLNCGFRPGLAAGTDYPCNDRKPIGELLTYVSIPSGKLTYRSWIEGIAHGRTVISTNGHDEFLDLKVNGKVGPGEEIRLTKGGQVSIAVRWTASSPLSGRVELVRNGEVAATQQGTASAAAPVVLRTSVEFKDSGWLCARRMNEQGHQTHTAAVFVTVNQAPVRASAEDALYFVRFIDNLLQNTSPGGPWNQYFVKDLAAAQDRYRRAREIFRGIAVEARLQSRP